LRKQKRDHLSETTVLSDRLNIFQKIIKS